MKNYLFLLILLLGTFHLVAQDEAESTETQEDVYTYQTFKSVRIINMHSTETQDKRTLNFVIGHKFGDLAGTNGGLQSFFGLENASDVMIGFEYGITDNIAVGIARVKGAGALRQNFVGTLKYRILRQKNAKGMPLTMTFVGTSNYTTQKSIPGETIRAFTKFSHRFAYSAQLIVARKFGERFSFQVSPGYVHRNVVPFVDSNGLFYVGAAARLQISKVFGIIADANVPFSAMRTKSNGFYPAIGVGLEMETGGHIFQLNFTNATGITETDYIPYTRSNWLDGQFRLGFTISRTFKL